MNSFRHNPDSEENQEATKQNEREVFAAKMQAKVKRDGEYCPSCEMLLSQCECWDAVNQVKE